MKSSAKFCWECGRQLYQHKVCVEKEVDGHLRRLHKSCAKGKGFAPDWQLLADPEYCKLKKEMKEK